MIPGTGFELFCLFVGRKLLSERDENPFFEKNLFNFERNLSEGNYSLKEMRTALRYLLYISQHLSVGRKLLSERDENINFTNTSAVTGQ